ncbi:MAG: MgtC/SapB family protein [Anaerolineae bacterium]
MTILLNDVIKLLLALLVGGLIGAEREFRDKAAGFRTIILICVGAALFTIFSIKIGGADDPVRIAANIVSGIGFLGAGAILRGEERVAGLTTASTIWLTAALGMGIGGGYYLLSSAAAVIVLIVLWVFPFVEGRITRETQRTYHVVCAMDRQKLAQLEDMFRQCSLRTKGQKQKRGDEMICTWEAFGAPKNHDRLVEMFFDDADVKEFRY